MGHSQIAPPPITRKWREVVLLITFGAGAEEVAAAASAAMEGALGAAAHDPAVRHAFWLLTQVPTAAKSDDFPGELRRLGVYAGAAPTLPEICGGVIEAVDRRVQSTKGRTDLGELATLASVESLSSVAGQEMPSLFGPTHAAGDTHAALRKLATPAMFSVLAHDFFARLTRRYLDYYLSRELPNHIGLRSRFPTLGDHHHFDQALDAHCRQTALIVRQFAADWFSKHTFEGGIDPQKAGGFVHYAFEKIRRELVRRRDAEP
jgi:hypothetical protein